MAKRKFKQILKSGPEELDLDSGVTVRVSAFPAGLYEKVQARALEEFPDKVPPQKIIEVADGTETVDDLDNEAYLEEVAAVERKRNEFLGEAVYDICVEVVGIKEWEKMIKRLEKYQAPFPEDPEERRVEFLTSFALATGADYERVLASAVSQTLIRDPEVSARIQTFRGHLEGATPPDADAPGVDGDERLALESTLS